MKLLQELKNRLLEIKFGEGKNAQKEENRISKTLITKTFSEDEDLFLFI